MVLRHKVVRPLEYLAITGFNVKDVKVTQKAWIFPGQTFTVFDVVPSNYRIEIQAMSAEKLTFLVAAMFTIGPMHVDKQSLQRYAKLVSPHKKLPQNVRDNVKGVIEDQIRVLAASMTLEGILKGIEEFKKNVLGKVQQEISQFGMLLYQADFKELADVIGNEHISCLRQRLQEEAAEKAKLEEEARMKREKEMEERIKQNAAKKDAKRTVCSTGGEGKKEESGVWTEVRTYEDRREVDVAWSWAVSSDCGTSADCGTSSDCGTSGCGFSSSTDNCW